MFIVADLVSLKDTHLVFSVYMSYISIVPFSPLTNRLSDESTDRVARELEIWIKFRECPASN